MEAVMFGGLKTNCPLAPTSIWSSCQTPNLAVTKNMHTFICWVVLGGADGAAAAAAAVVGAGPGGGGG